MFIDESELEGQAVHIEFVPLDVAATWLWAENPKLHDIGAIVQSFQENGFRDPPSYDSKLVNQSGTEGALIEGNGRIEALVAMFNQKLAPPNGIPLHRETGKWCIPINFGLDASDKVAATRYAIDHNNLVMSGGDFTGVDMMRLWDSEKYLAVNQSLIASNQPAITVDADAVQGLKDALARQQATIYSRKIKTPIYEPSYEQPAIADLFNNVRTMELVNDIMTEPDLTDDERAFLITASHRHTVLIYDKIADYYSHASPAMQRLMEDSALVIIDFDRALELGYVNLTEDIRNQFSTDYDE